MGGEHNLQARDRGCGDRIGCTRTVSWHPPKLPRQLYAIPWDVLVACVPQPYGDGLQHSERLNGVWAAYLPLGQFDVILQLGFDRKACGIQEMIDVGNKLPVVSMQRTKQRRERRPRRRGGCVKGRVAVEHPKQRHAPLEFAQRSATQKLFERCRNAAQPNGSFSRLLRRSSVEHQAIKREPCGVCGVRGCLRDCCQSMRPGVHLSSAPTHSERGACLQL